MPSPSGSGPYAQVSLKKMSEKKSRPPKRRTTSRFESYASWERVRVASGWIGVLRAGQLDPSNSHVTPSPIGPSPNRTSTPLARSSARLAYARGPGGFDELSSDHSDPLNRHESWRRFPLANPPYRMA